MIVPILTILVLITVYVIAIINTKRHYLVSVVDVGDLVDNAISIIISPLYLIFDVANYISKIKIRDDKNEFYDFGN